MLFKRVLILSDYSDLIKHQKVDPLIIKQIYTIIFLLKHFSDIIHLNDRSGLSYRHLWKENSYLQEYIDPFLINTPWDDIDFLQYDLIICHFDYDISLRHYYNADNIYMLVNPTYKPAQGVFKSVTTLFHSGGICEVPEQLKTGALKSFKHDLNTYYTGSTKKDYEKLFHEQLTKIITANKYQTYKKILILDDYKRSFFIGDSTVWVRFFKKVLRHCGNYCEVVINCNNLRTAPRLQELYIDTFGEKVIITSLSWEQIDFSSFDLILVESDLAIKFLLYINKIEFHHTNIYTVTTLIEEHAEDNYNWDFFNNHQITEIEKNNADKEIYISGKELEEADQWLEQQGIIPTDYLIILQNGSAEDKKVLRAEEFITLVRKLLQKEGVKILVLDDITKEENNRIIFTGERNLRRDMCLIAGKYTKLVIGPCTGIFHLANGAITYLVNKGLKDRKDIPYMLVYTGKQAHDEGYLPKNWWNNSFVQCAVIVKHALVSLEDSPDDIDTFQAIAGEVHAITAEMLLPHLKL